MAGSEIKMKMALDSSGIKAGIDNANSKISSFASNSIEKFKGIIKSGLAPLAAAFTIGGAKKLIDDMVELGRHAERLGVGVESFQRLAFAAKQTGVDTEGLADAMKDLDVKLQDGIMRGGSFAELIQELGLDMNELAKMPADQRMLAFADAIQNASGSLSRFGADEFGDKMFELLPLLEKGSAGILELGESATVMSAQQIAAAERASQKIDATIGNMTAQLSIWLGEALGFFEWLVAGVTAAVSEMGGRIQAFGDLLQVALNPKNILEPAKIKDAFAEFIQSGEEAGARVKKAMSDVLDDQIVDKHKAQQSQMTAAELARLKSTTDAAKASAAKREADEKKIGGIRDKIAAEVKKRIEDELDTEEKLKMATEERVKTKQELLEIDPFENELAAAEKQLELEKAITKENELMADAQKEAADARDQAAQKAREDAEALAAERKEATEKILETELAIALANGDDDAVRIAQERLDVESAIHDMVSRTGMSEEQARKTVEAINDQLRKKKDIQGDLLDAQANQNVELQHELSKQIDLEQKISEIMNGTNKSREEAIELARKLQAIEAGPDLDGSGVVTPREQREFDRQQRERDRHEQQRVRDEIGEEGELGGNIRNVSREKRDTGNVRDRAEQAAEGRLRRAENREIQRRRNRGEDMDDIMADINQRRADREPKIPDGVPPGGPRKPGDPEHPNGPGNEPKQPENPVVKSLEPILDKQLTELQEIKKALKC